MKKVLISAPYLMPSLKRFEPVFNHYGIETIVADVNERLEEEETFEICRDVRWRDLRRRPV